MIGRTLSHYKILSEISRGGMGIVYRALDLNLDREVASQSSPSRASHGSRAQTSIRPRSEGSGEARTSSHRCGL